MANDGNRIYIGATGVEIADLQQVLGRGVNDLGLLCSDQEWSGSSLVRANKIRPMAKYKPVRHSKLGILTSTERSSTRYGFGGGLLPTLNLSQNSPQNDWVYYPPRGAANNEWFRIRDFEGYVQDACSPLAITVGQLVYDGESQILIFGDGYSNAIRGDGHTWVADESLSIMELLHSGGTTYEGNYIAFLLIDKTASTHNKNLIVTNKTISNLVNNEYSHYIFKIYAEGNGDDPAVPILSQSNSGHTFQIIMCLMTGNYPTIGNYAVFTPENFPGFLSLVPYSLGFESGCDRTEATLDTGAFKMDGTTITSISVIATDMASEETVSGQVFRAYNIEIRASISTMGAAAYTGTMTISGLMTFGTSGMFGPTASQGISLPPQGVAVTLESKTAGQNKLLWGSGGVNYMWIPKVNGAVVRTSLQLDVDFSYPFSAGSHATKQDTFYIPN